MTGCDTEQVQNIMEQARRHAGQTVRPMNVRPAQSACSAKRSAPLVSPSLAELNW